MDFWQKLFSGSDFIPRRLCGDWGAGLIWLHVASDAVIFLSYLWIPLIMFRAFRGQGNKLVIPPATWLLLTLYILFITVCGFTHFFDALMFWNPVYRINGLVRAFTAVVSFMTAVSLARLIPVAITAPVAMNAQERLVRQQQAWLRDILDAATGGVLHLCRDAKDLPGRLTDQADDQSSRVTAGTAADLRKARSLILRLAGEAGFNEERADGLVTATHEAAMNALRHAGGGVVEAYRSGETIQVWVTDKGGGIPLDKLPITTLKQGYSTAGTAGQGWFLMLSSVDAAYLKTGEDGTTIVLRMSARVPEPVIRLSQWVGGDIDAPGPSGVAA